MWNLIQTENPGLKSNLKTPGTKLVGTKFPGNVRPFKCEVLCGRNQISGQRFPLKTRSGTAGWANKNSPKKWAKKNPAICVSGQNCASAFLYLPFYMVGFNWKVFRVFFSPTRIGVFFICPPCRYEPKFWAIFTYLNARYKSVGTKFPGYFQLSIYEAVSLGTKIPGNFYLLRRDALFCRNQTSGKYWTPQMRGSV